MSDPTSALTTLINLVTAVGVISVSAERLTAIIKGFIPLLNANSPDDPKAEARRCSLVYLLSAISGSATAWLARDTLPMLPVGTGTLNIAIYGLLASGGSGLWNSILHYLIGIKDAAQAMAKKIQTDPVPVVIAK